MLELRCNKTPSSASWDGPATDQNSDAKPLRTLPSRSKRDAVIFILSQGIIGSTRLTIFATEEIADCIGLTAPLGKDSKCRGADISNQDRSE